MFRVIYEWRVPEESFDKFQQAWATTTDAIHKSVPGALGSFMLRSPEESEKVLTIAKWSDRESWETFFQNSNPQQMAAMRAIAERVSVQGFDEIQDRTR